MNTADTPSKEQLEQRVRALSDAITSAKHDRSSGPVRRGAPHHYFGHQAHSRPYYSRAIHHRGSHHASHGPHRNRTLVIQQPSHSTDESNQSALTDSNIPDGDQWVSKRDRHFQLINKSVYDKMVEERSNIAADTNRGVVTAADPTALPVSCMSSFRYLARNDGISHLGPAAVHQRGGNIASPRPSYPSNPSVSVASYDPVSGQPNFSRRAKTVLCRTFTSTGQCRKGPSCKYLHNPAKVAICKEFLSKGTCHLGLSCNLSHEPTPHRAPACIHFIRGNCTNTQCRYVHVNVNPNAPICSAFANIGYCEKGASCLDRHEFECPDYALKGSCANPRCRMPHIDRAGQLRKVSKPGQSTDTAETTDLTPMDIVHEADDPAQAQASNSSIVTGPSNAGPVISTSSNHGSSGTEPGAFSQQQNFLSLNVDPQGEYEEMFRSSSEDSGI